ncbi:MAG: tat (twin-arginine translocation) pathway signal sequence [Geminicoccaceae bacterium]
MTRESMNRRAFLESTGHAAVGVAVVASAGTTMLIAPDGAWAMTLQTLDGHAAKTLIGALRVIYPHDALGDQYYAEVVEALDQDAQKDAAAAEMLKVGVADLDRAMPVSFLELSEGNRLQVLEAMESSDFFQKIRFKTVSVLYNNHRVWEAFGYEGASFDDGGYIDRGFDDLGWLPDPPEEASPAKA